MSPVRAVLDTTAINTYTLGSLAVGEILREFADEGVAFGLPVLCLIRAAQNASYSAERLRLLDLLVALPHCVIRPVTADRWHDTSSAATLLGSLERATAALAVVHGEADYVMTGEAHAYGDGIETIEV